MISQQYMTQIKIKITCPSTKLPNPSFNFPEKKLDASRMRVLI